MTQIFIINYEHWAFSSGLFPISSYKKIDPFILNLHSTTKLLPFLSTSNPTCSEPAGKIHALIPSLLPPSPHKTCLFFPAQLVPLSSSLNRSETPQAETTLYSVHRYYTATLRFLLTPVRITKSNKTTANKCLKVCGETGELIQCWWDCKLVYPFWISALKILTNTKKKRKEICNVPCYTMALLCHFIKGLSILSHRHLLIYIHYCSRHNSQEMETTYASFS